MIKRAKTGQEKEAIVAEYLIGETSYRKLGAKHGVDYRKIHTWVSKFSGKTMKKEKANTSKHESHSIEELPNDVKQLQKELRMARLHNELLNAMIDIAQDQLKIDIRKKSGTKR